jgi:glycosyltransferase involved in cell wall biosynthesis
MKVVYLSPAGHLGGAERCLLEMLATVRAARPAWPLFLVAAADGPLLARARSLGVTSSVLPFPPRLARLGDAPLAPQASGASVSRLRRLGGYIGAILPSVRYARLLGSLLAGLRPDVIHSNGLKMDVLGARTRPAGSALIWHVHDYVSSRPLTSRLLQHHSARCTVAIANSHSVAADIRKICGKLPVSTVHNTVDLETFSPLPQTTVSAGTSVEPGKSGSPDVADLDKLCGLSPAPAGTVRVGLVATMAHWKGHEVFLEALVRLPASSPVRGYVVGGAVYQPDGSQHSPAELKAAAERLGIADRVGLTGFVEEPATIMRALDVVVHASTQPEPFGLVVAEAMACGRAVIASAAGGVLEIIEPGVNALAHPPGNSGALADAIERLVADPALRVRLGRAAREAAVRQFSRERLTQQLLSTYESVAGF